MSDLNWCTFCDNAINPFSRSLYCSDQCLRADALRNHPLLGYTYPDCIHFVRRSNNLPVDNKIIVYNLSSTSISSTSSSTTTTSSSPVSSLTVIPYINSSHSN